MAIDGSEDGPLDDLSRAQPGCVRTGQVAGLQTAGKGLRAYRSPPGRSWSGAPGVCCWNAITTTSRSLRRATNQGSSCRGEKRLSGSAMRVARSTVAHWPCRLQTTRSERVQMSEVQENAATRRRRSGRAHSTNGPRSSTAGSSRGRQPAEQVVAELEPMISALIKENRELHRQIDKLTKQSVGAGSAAAERSLRSLERRVRGSLDGRTTPGRRRSAGAASMPRARRKVTDPELLERRRQALAKAREARAAKRASAQQ
jgi:hypothetical protein